MPAFIPQYYADKNKKPVLISKILPNSLGQNI